MILGVPPIISLLILSYIATIGASLYDPFILKSHKASTLDPKPGASYIDEYPSLQTWNL